MSDVQSRPAPARGSRSSAARGGRGGFSSRGARNSARTAPNGDAKHDQEATSLPTLEDQGEIADLNKAYGAKIATVKSIFPEWSDVDILYALKETDGDETKTIERIIEGATSQWGEVSQKKDRAKAKAKDALTTTTGADVPVSNANNRPARGGRPETARGRGRAPERGARGAARGRSGAPATNGARPKDYQPLSVPTDESNAWDTARNNDDGGWASAAAATSWEPAATSPSDPAATAWGSSHSADPLEPVKSAVIPQGTSKTWASMLRQSVVPKPAPQPPREPPAPQPEPVLEPLPAAPESPAAPEPEAEHETIAEPPTEPPPEHAPEDDPTVAVAEVALLPSNDQLTKTNLEQVADVSHPPETDTAASEAADSWDPRAATGSTTATPISASQAQHQSKTPVSGHAARAIKATERAPVPRAPAHPQRRFLDQQEAVRMPGAVSQQLEQTNMQFGSLNVNDDEDIDGDREEPETRAQPPADSPVAQPRASLPPAPPPVPDAYTVPKPASLSPSGPAPPGPQAPPTAPAAQQPVVQAAASQIPTQPAAQQYGRFGQAASDPTGFAQKPLDAYNQASQPAAAQSHFEGFANQQQSQPQPQSQQPGALYSSGADQYSAYYTADQQSRAPYQNYYGQSYGQQQQGGQGHEGNLASRAGFGGGYGATQADLAAQYPQSANQSRFGAAVAHDQNSGPSTPVPQTSQGPPASQAHVGQQQHGNQFYSQQQPYYNQYSQNYGYPNSYGGGYGGAAFGGYSKAGGGYGQPHYQQQQPYDHATTTAGAGYPQSTLHRADAGTAPGLGEYPRTAGVQPGAQPSLGGAGFGGGIHDTFTRGSSYGAQAGQSYNAGSTQAGASGNDDLKPFGDGKTAGPSPAMVAGGRPGSATNQGPSHQGGLAPPPSQQSMGMYAGFPGQLPSHGLHGTQSASAGYGMGAGSAQGQQHTPYAGYNAFGGGSNSYYNSQQQQQQQQHPRGGWGSNYNNGGNGNY